MIFNETKSKLLRFREANGIRNKLTLLFDWSRRSEASNNFGLRVYKNILLVGFVYFGAEQWRRYNRDGKWIWES
jgi:hypothetical protein